MKESKLEIVRNKKHLILAPLQALGIEYTSGTTLTSFHNKLWCMDVPRYMQPRIEAAVAAPASQSAPHDQQKLPFED